MDEFMLIKVGFLYCLAVFWLVTIIITMFIATLYQCDKDVKEFTKISQDTHEFYRKQLNVYAKEFSRRSKKVRINDNGKNDC